MFSIGICATGKSPGLPALLQLIEQESYPPGFRLSKEIVVASECSGEVVGRARSIAETDPCIVLLEQDKRRGKADAINEIIRTHEGEFLVLVNADAAPAPGAISKLLEGIGHDEKAGVISGVPVIDTGTGITHEVVILMWETHNTCSRDLNDTREGNHCTDELMVVRSVALGELPTGVVNDGAYIAGTAYSLGYRVGVLESAPVIVRVPSSIRDVIKQRRRIIFGHMQVWKLLGTAPKTAEFLALRTPWLGAGFLVETVARHPRLIISLPFAFVCEVISFFGAMFDLKSGGARHVIWERVGD